MQLSALLPAGRHREWYIYHTMPLILFIGTLYFFFEKSWTISYWLIFVAYYLVNFSIMLLINHIFALHHSKQGDEIGYPTAFLFIAIILLIAQTRIKNILFPSTIYFIFSGILAYITFCIYSRSPLNIIPSANEEYNKIKTDYERTDKQINKNLEKKKTNKYGEV